MKFLLVLVVLVCLSLADFKEDVARQRLDNELLKPLSDFIERSTFDELVAGIASNRMLGRFFQYRMESLSDLMTFLGEIRTVNLKATSIGKEIPVNYLLVMLRSTRAAQTLKDYLDMTYKIMGWI